MSVLEHLAKNNPDPDVAEALAAIGKNIGGKAEVDAVCASVAGYIPAQTYDNIGAIPMGAVTVVNYVTQQEANEGHYGHWVCIDNRRADKIMYLDPYGLKPDVARTALHLPGGTNLRDKLNASRGDRPIAVNRVQYQDLVPNDDACGAWASLFVTQPYDPSLPIYRDVPPTAMRDLEIERQFTQASHS